MNKIGKLELQELSENEMRNIEGGSFLLIAGILVGLLVGAIVATAIQSDGKCEDCKEKTEA